MTFQPPPPGNQPPGGQPPGAPAAAAWPVGRPARRTPRRQRRLRPAAVNPLDWGILAAGLLAFIFSLFDYYTVTRVVQRPRLGVGAASQRVARLLRLVRRPARARRRRARRGAAVRAAGEHARHRPG